MGTVFQVHQQKLQRQIIVNVAWIVSEPIRSLVWILRRAWELKQAIRKELSLGGGALDARVRSFAFVQ